MRRPFVLPCPTLYLLLLLSLFIIANMFKNPNIKVAAKKIHVEATPVAKKPTPLPPKQSVTKKPHGVRSSASSARSSPALSNAKSSPATSPSDDHELPSSRYLQVHKSKSTRPISPSYKPKFDDSEDESEGTPIEEPVAKRRKVQGEVVDLKRRVRSKKAFSEDDGAKLDIIHAADLPAPKKHKPTAHVSIEDIILELKYPSASLRERSVFPLSLLVKS